MISIPLLSIKVEPIAVYRDMDNTAAQTLLDEALAGGPLSAYIECLYDQWIVESLKRWTIRPS